MAKMAPIEIRLSDMPEVKMALSAAAARIGELEDALRLLDPDHPALRSEEC